MILKNFKKPLSRIFGARKAKRLLVGAGVAFARNDTYKLDEAFVWGESPQGHDFWTEVYPKLNNGKRFMEKDGS
jgi:hypothetical protein